MTDPTARLRRYQGLLAPGTPLRSGLERILAGRTGALIVLGTNKVVQASSTGGFPLNIDFTPTRLRELAKMDGGIVMSNDLRTILAAGVHLVSDPVPSDETGTRHRSADQLAKVSGIPVVTVSASMSTISLFLDGRRYAFVPSAQILDRANQALATLARYRERLGALLATLTALEVREQVTVRDVVAVAQRLELIRRLTAELHGYVTELGVDGRLLQLQLTEMTHGLDDLPELLARDYAQSEDEPLTFGRLLDLTDTDLLDVTTAARALGFSSSLHPESRLVPRGHRVLASIPRLPTGLAERLIDHFGALQALFGASVSDLQQIEGIGTSRARSIRDMLVRLSESSYHGTDQG